MATDIHIDHEIRCDAETFWDKVFFDVEYNKGLYLGALKFPKWEQLSLDDRGTSLFRKVRATPPQDAPGPIKKMLGGEFWYDEEATFDKATKRLRFKNIPSKMTDKIRIEGTMRADPTPAGRIRRIADITLSVSIFGLGGMVENFVADMLRKSFDRGARFTSEWAEKKGWSK